MSRSSRRGAFLPLTLLALAGTGQSVVYVTDLPLFSGLAPCAASAVSYNIMSQTRSKCPEAVTDLQGCICTKNNNIAPIASAISSSVSYSCGSTATDDQASAATVLSAYCSQDAMPTFAAPSIVVSSFITDLPEFQHLAGCAKSALSQAVQSMTYSYCPPEASNLATCACQKNQNSLRVSQIINSSVRYSCASHAADMTSAQAMFSAYCKMAQSGISSFPQPSAPPGDMSYYITALPQYSSMAPCAQSAVSYAVKSQSSDYCPEGVQALASCVCIKESVFGSVSSSITSGVKWSCASTATEDITSALSVLDFYCSAAKNQVRATGVAESLLQTYPTPRSGTLPPGPAATGGGKPGSGSSPSGSGGSGEQGTNGGTSGQTKDSNVGVIAGAVGGGAAILLGILATVFFIMRNARRKKAAEQIAMVGPGGSGGYNDGGGKPELDGTQLTTAAVTSPSSPSPSMLKIHGSHNRADNISPVSAHYNGGALAPPPPTHATELHNDSRWSQASQNVSPTANSPYDQHGELPAQYGNRQQQQAYPGPSAHEMQGQQTYSAMIRPELHGSPQSPNAPPPLQFAPGGFQGQQHSPAQISPGTFAAFPRPPSSADGPGSATPHAHASEAGSGTPQQYLRPGHVEAPGMSWHSGPIAGYSKLEGGGYEGNQHGRAR